MNWMKVKLKYGLVAVAFLGGFYSLSDAKTEVVRPTTKIAVFRPVTQTVVPQLKTTTVVSRPTDNTVVTRPTTTVRVLRPGEVPLGGAEPKKDDAPAAAPAKTATGGNSVPSSASATSMAGFQGLQAKDFKAPALGGGEQGLGNNINEAQRDAEVAAFQKPKAEDASSIASILEAGQKASKGALAAKVEQEVAKQQTK